MEGNHLKRLYVLIVVLLFGTGLWAWDGNWVHTYSIVARDSRTGEMGVAVQSHWFSVGSIVTWAEAGVGAIATQALVNPGFGPEGLQLLRSGMDASQTLRNLIEGDEGRDYRQLAVIDSKGHVAAWTGKKCIASAQHLTGKNFSVQANMMLNDKVVPAMAAAFRKARGSLAEKMVAALEAGQNAGGDIRGMQSAAILVVRGEPTGRIWEDRLIDLRVEDHPQPLQELRRLLRIDAAYKHMNAGDAALELQDHALALREYSLAEKLLPDNLEIRYWHAVALANMGKVEAALPIFREVFDRDENWRLLTERIYKVEMLKVSSPQLESILGSRTRP